MKILYRPSWQRLRVSFISSYHPLGGFTTIDGTTNNLQRLANYLSDAGFVANATNTTGPVAQWTQIENTRMNYSPEDELALRLYRAINLLNATRMGYSGQNQTGSPMDVAVANYRNELQPHYNASLTTKLEDSFDTKNKTYSTQQGLTKNLTGWDVVEYELETMWREDRYWFTAIYDDLGSREYRANRRQQTGKGGQASIAVTRADLLHFTNLMRAINRHP